MSTKASRKMIAGITVYVLLLWSVIVADYVCDFAGSDPQLKCSLKDTRLRVKNQDTSHSNDYLDVELYNSVMHHNGKDNRLYKERSRRLRKEVWCFIKKSRNETSDCSLHSGCCLYIDLVALWDSNHTERSHGLASGKETGHNFRDNLLC